MLEDLKLFLPIFIFGNPHFSTIFTL